MDFIGKRALVIGAGRSGQAAVGKLEKLGAEVFLTDAKPIDILEGVEDLGLDLVHCFFGGMPEFKAVRPERVILSPGVSPKQKLIETALAEGVPVWSEVELALQDVSAFKVGVTGTNGKTTTTTLVGELAKRTGRKTVVAGNIGVALSSRAEGMGPEDIVVAELSSFQLEFIDKVRLDVAIFLNLTPDHLDRHGTVEAYLEAKARIFKNQTKEDLAILNGDDPLVRSLAPRLKAKVLFFSPTRVLDEGIGLSGDAIVYAENGEKTVVMRRQELKLRGSHNLENVMAAIGAARFLRLSWEEIREGLKSFQGVEHRQEIVGTFDGILFVNDSKGTNTDAAAKAVLAFDEPLILLAGGKNKGLDFHEFMKLVQQRVKSLVLLGMAAAEMEQAARDEGVKRILRANSFEEGVEIAIQEAESGDVVLLSPACTSWDMFKSYEERGELFKKLVRKHYRT